MNAVLRAASTAHSAWLPPEDRQRLTQRMRVLVTGASGFVGQHLTRVLVEHGEEVISWGLVALPGEASVALDLCEPGEIRRQDLRGLDAVIHLAGLAQVSRSFSEPAHYIATNTAMQVNLFEALMAQRSFPRVLVVSTGGVYTGSEAPITEASATDPTSPYVVSKLAQELLGAYYAKRGFEIVVARPFNHVGPGQERGYLVADICSQIAAAERHGGGEISVGNLASSRDYTDVRDVAVAYMSLISAGRAGQTYNVCSEHSLTGHEVISRLRSLSGVKLDVVGDEQLSRPTDTNSVHASAAKIRCHTGWEPKIPFDVTLEDALDYWRACVDS